jgi:hypothetical protein
MKQLCTITERSGDAEYSWYTIALHDEPSKDILEEFFGDLDEESNEWGEKWLTSDWCSAVWITSRRDITDEEVSTLSKFYIV